MSKLNKDYDLIIVGGGPAGMSSAIYGARSGLKCLIIEKLFLGGQVTITDEICNYPGFAKTNGFELASLMENQVKNLNVDIKIDSIINIDLKEKIITTKLNKYKCKAIILAMGATARTMGLKNEEEFTGKGISYCAVCDGNFFKGKNVVVFGTGNSAVESAIYLAKLVKSLTIVSKYPEFKCQEVLLKEFNSIIKKYKNIKSYMNYLPTELIADDKVKGIKILENTTHEEITINCDGIFVCIGRYPDSSLIKDQLEVTEKGYIISDENMHTALDGIFVAGDIRDKKLRQIVTACSDGAIAATEARMYISQQNMIKK